MEKDWPLYIQDNEGEQHMVMLEPGEMVWYEAARLIHGRPQPLQGEYYDNAMVGFRSGFCLHLPGLMFIFQSCRHVV